jgi:hypothetical protein
LVKGPKLGGLSGFLSVKIKFMTTIIVFFSSFFIASALIAVKTVEIKYGKSNFILGLLNKFDAESNKLISSVRFKALQIIQSVRYIILVQTKAVCKNLLDKVEERIMNEYKSRHTMVMMGHKNIATNRGSVSFYLKKIAEEKYNNQGGKIENIL